MKNGFGFALLTGIVIGAAAGILLAPDKGSETRKKIRGSIDEAKEKLRERILSARQQLQDLNLPNQEDFFDEIENASEEVISTLEQKLAGLKAEVSRMRNKKEA